MQDNKHELSWQDVLSGLESYLDALQLATAGQSEWPPPYSGGPGVGEMTSEERVRAEAILARIRLLEGNVVEMRDGVGASLATLNSFTSTTGISGVARANPIYVDKRA